MIILHNQHLWVQTKQWKNVWHDQTISSEILRVAMTTISVVPSNVNTLVPFVNRFQLSIV